MGNYIDFLIIGQAYLIDNLYAFLKKKKKIL